MVRAEVVSAVAGAPRAVAVVGAGAGVKVAAEMAEVAAARVEVAAAEEAASVPIVPAVVATATGEYLMAAVGDATGGATSGRSASRRRGTSSSSVLGAWVLATRKARAHRTRRCWRAADVRRGSRRGSPGVRDEGNRQVQSDGWERSRGWRARQAGRAIYRR